MFARDAGVLRFGSGVSPRFTMVTTLFVLAVRKCGYAIHCDTSPNTID
jgi:hypothetical protein